jgi:hypothetical protein
MRSPPWAPEHQAFAARGRVGAVKAEAFEGFPNPARSHSRAGFSYCGLKRKPREGRGFKVMRRCP